MNRWILASLLFALASCKGKTVPVTPADPMGKLEDLQQAVESKNLIIKLPEDADVPETNARGKVVRILDERANTKTDEGAYRVFIYTDAAGKVCRVEGQYFIGYTGSPWSPVNDFLIMYWQALGGPEQPAFGPKQGVSVGAYRQYKHPNPAVDMTYTVVDMDQNEKIKAHQFLFKRK